MRFRPVQMTVALRFGLKNTATIFLFLSAIRAKASSRSILKIYSIRFLRQNRRAWGLALRLCQKLWMSIEAASRFLASLVLARGLNCRCQRHSTLDMAAGRILIVEDEE